MNDAQKVRFSRDGDQFHYLWAARQCLRLLSPASGLVAISIEGASAREAAPGEAVEEGEEFIDLAEYYASEEAESATRIRYVQLKHSTQHAATPWTFSGLERTLKGFAKRHVAFERRRKNGKFTGRAEFLFATNRPISATLRETIEDAAAERVPRHPKTLEKLNSKITLKGDALSSFLRLLRLEGGNDAYQGQRSNLAQETGRYLVGDDVDAPVRLKELVTRKALSESAGDPSIRKVDVLRALGTSEDRLFPAHCLIEEPHNAISRSQEALLASRVVSADVPVIIHAAGGVGKSVLSRQLGHHLPPGSFGIVYDCFGNGTYRRAGSPRHRHKDALVQIANELASLGVCDPLIPSPQADNAEYLKAFIHRLQQAVTSVRSGNENALIYVGVDAADSAELAAREFGNERSFARDLVREEMPAGVRLVLFCRTERQYLLAPPPHALAIELEPFDRAETAVFLRSKYPEASESDVDEFHRLTSQNPRLQATVLDASADLFDALRSLGPTPKGVNDAIEDQLERAVARLQDQAGHLGYSEIEALCKSLAILRPFVPIDVLAAASGVPASTVRSFAADLGRPLLLTDDAIQFRDEPVETWFRQRFRPAPAQLGSYIDVLAPLAGTSAYVASSLPELMLEAGRLDALIDIALTSAGLPEGNPIERRDVELQRLQFALKASLRSGRYLDATKVALKSAEETTADCRQKRLLQENTDLAPLLLEPIRIQEIVSRRMFGGSWLGSHNAFEASLLSHVREFHGEARSRLRMAEEWIWNWSRLPKEERRNEQIDNADIAELAIAHFNLNGPEACAKWLRGWRPAEVAFHAGRILARRLVDHGRYDDLEKLAASARDDVYLILAAAVELREVCRILPKPSVDRALKLVRVKRLSIRSPHGGLHDEALEAITVIVEAGQAHRLSPAGELSELLRAYLPEAPPQWLGSRTAGDRMQYPRAYCLEAALRGVDIQLSDLAHPNLREILEGKKRHSDTREIHDFKFGLGSVLPWHQLRVRTFLSPDDKNALAASISDAKRAFDQLSQSLYVEEPYTTDEVARIWFEALVICAEDATDLVDSFEQWTRGLKRPLFAPTWITLARIAARTPTLQKYAHRFAQYAMDIVASERPDADVESKSYVELARSLVALDLPEAQALFNQAIEVMSKIGDEIVDRWEAILHLAHHASDPARRATQTAYQLSRCAEVAYKYVQRDKHYRWEGTVTAIAGLCPPSSLAILSRWRDRNFGWWSRLLPALVRHLLEKQQIGAKQAIALIGFRAEWQFGEFLRGCISAGESPSERKDILDHAVRYLRFDDQSSSAWKAVQEIANALDISIPEIDILVSLTCRGEEARRRRTDAGFYAPQPEGDDEEAHLESVFASIDVSTASGIGTAHERWRKMARQLGPKNFARELFARVPVGRAANCISALPECKRLSLYDFRLFLENVPEAWSHRMAVRRALAGAVRTIVRLFSTEITKSPHYQILPLRLASEVAGLSEGELIDIAISALSESRVPLDAGRLFAIVGLLTQKLSPDDALVALQYGLSLFDRALSEDDGDGNWTSHLAPPNKTSESLAGYVWAALGAPQAAVRWQAAHVVRALCKFGEQDVLAQLRRLASGGTGGPFTDARLHFYDLHARQWLLIAVARAALESPSSLSGWADYLVEVSLRGEPHVVIRHFASTAALALSRGGHVLLNQSTINDLERVNAPALPVVHFKRFEHRRKGVPNDQRAKRFHFGYDMSRYWFEALSDRFALTAPEIEIEVEKVICDEWQVPEDGSWKADGRVRLGTFKGQETYHSHGSYPPADNLSFYLSYHGLMVVAGKLLATAPVHRDPDYDAEDLTEWMQRHLLSRRDGRWLFDRRDPSPLERPNWKDEAEDGDWRSSVSPPDFNRAIGLDGERLNVWGRWTAVSGTRQEDVSVTSALVATDRSLALLRALQTATNPHDHRIPAVGDDLEIDDDGFRLSGWVEEGNGDSGGLDKLDPWVGDIAYPPVKPASSIRALVHLEADDEHRTWRRCSEGRWQEVIWSQLWGCSRDAGQDDNEGESGRRLQVRRSFLKALLNAVEMDLILEVTIQRRIRPYRFESRDDDAYTRPYFQIFLFRRDGRCCTLRGSSEAWTEDR